MQQFGEGLDEDLCQASPKTLLGLVPFGQEFDDAAKPTPRELFSEKQRQLVRDPLEAVEEAVEDFFAP